MTDPYILESIEQLQTKMAFQEDTIDALNNALTSQQKQIEKLEFQIRHLVDKVKQQQSSNIASEAEEPPPPHY